MQIAAANDEGTSPWSDSGAGSTEPAAIKSATPSEPVVSVPTVSFRADGAAVSEGWRVEFAVEASSAPGARLSVMVRISGGGAFYLADGSRTVTIHAGEVSAVLSLPTANDGRDEPDGTVTAAVQEGEGYAPGEPASG